MSFSSIAGGFLKLPRLFLEICRWVLVSMALNCLLSGSKRRFLTNSKPNKEKKKKKKEEVFQGSSSSGWVRWRKKLLFVWVLGTIVCSIWILSGLGNNGDSREKKLSDFWQTKAQILNHNNFNANANANAKANAKAFAFPSLLKKSDQKSPLACIEKRRFQVPQSNDIACPLNILCLELERIEKHHNCVTDKLEAKDQCPVRFEHISDMFEPRSPYKRSDSSAAELSQDTNSYLQNNRTNKENVSQMSKLDNSREEHCEGVSTGWLKIFWYTIVGVIFSWKFSGYCERWLVEPEQEVVKQQQQQQNLLPLQQNQQLLLSQHFAQRSGLWRTKLLVIFIVSGLIGSIWVFWYMNNNLVTSRREMLSNMCDERARMLQDQFNVSMNHVHALAILVSTFHHGKQPSVIDQKIFADYTERTAFERPLTSGVAYALKVAHSEREEFEKLHGWKIKKMETEEDESGGQDYTPEDLEPSPIQDEYAPVIFSQETVSHIVSIDMMSGKEDRENILRARASGKGVLTSPFPLLKSNHLGVVLTFAVYNTNLPADTTPEERIAATKGYLGASYDIPSLVEKLLHQLASKQDIVVNVYDTTDSSEPINMYGPRVIDTGLLHRSSLDFGDPSRRHEMRCRFTHKDSLPWIAIMSAFGVIVITLLVSHIFYAAINRIAKVEGDYCKMMELKVRAEAADVAKSQFLATVSHEIRTPMNGVLGMLQMLMDTELDGHQHEFARTAYGSGKDLISLINEVLDQAKIESGRMELEAVNFDLRTSLDNVLSLFTGKCHTKGIELAVYVSSQVPEVMSGDPGRFRQIVTNLIGNSIKFTERGHIFVTVHLADEVRNPLEVRDEVLRQQVLVKNGAAASGNTLSGFPVVDRWRSWETFHKLNSENGTEATELIRLIVTVEDTGVGIPPEAQSRIFTPFMQADSSTSRNYGGTGIGLSISKCLVGIMGGEIGFASDCGIGSSFTFTSIFAKEKPESPDTNQDSFALSINEFRGLRGLVVDGKSTRAEVTKYHLQRLGISVEIATSLKSACSYISNSWDSCANTHLDMVLVEKDSWNDGTALVSRHTLKELCQNGKQRPPKIFILTSSRPDKLNELKAFGCVDDIIVKPLRLSMMSTCFQQALGGGTKKYQAKRKPSNLQSLLSGKQILVVDDNIVNLRVAEGALKKYGALVTCVNSGKAAVEKLQPPHQFDACFMDLQMPGMDGFEATKHIRNFESELNERIKCGEADMEMLGNVKQWHTPILAMTADVIQATHQKCASWGMDDYVSKPFEEEQLYSAVLRFFV